MKYLLQKKLLKRLKTVTTPTTEDKVTNKINNNKKSQKTTAVKQEIVHLQVLIHYLRF